MLICVRSGKVMVIGIRGGSQDGVMRRPVDLMLQRQKKYLARMEEVRSTVHRWRPGAWTGVEEMAKGAEELAWRVCVNEWGREGE